MLYIVAEIIRGLMENMIGISDRSGAARFGGEKSLEIV